MVFIDVTALTSDFGTGDPMMLLINVRTLTLVKGLVMVSAMWSSVATLVTVIMGNVYHTIPLL